MRVAGWLGWIGVLLLAHGAAIAQDLALYEGEAVVESQSDAARDAALPQALAAALVRAFTPGMRQRLAANASAPDERFTFARMLSDTDAELRRWLR